MKTMVVWRTVPGKYKSAIDQFLKTGGPSRPASRHWVVGTSQGPSSGGI